ncbi:lantibiotic dehydratase [Streptomyces sp. NPDC049881]|uniref:lantibiotic dehydratase n=1 Tax=Streptomyces sp. NPDC049881 TaxID=3155778 RepID=UPI003435F23F
MRSVFTARSVAMARLPLTPVAAAPAPGLLAEGVFLASRSLDAADPTPHADSARTAYALRASTRTTPNGVWCAAGVARLNAADTGPIRWGERFHTMTVPAPHWLLVVADNHLEAALDQLTVCSNNLAVRRGRRWEAERPGLDGDAVLCSVAATDLSDWLLATCSRPVAVQELLIRICQRYPDADQERPHTALAQLVRTGMLLTDLLPEDLRSDPLEHLLRRLDRHHPTHGRLTELRGLLREADDLPPGSGRRLDVLRHARTVADAIHFVDRPLTVDTASDSAVRLPADIGVRAAEAASLLWRIGHRTGPLQQWTRRFTSLYGRARLVPLLEAVDPVIGVGPPAPEDAIGAGSALDEIRARHLAVLHNDALVRGLPEIALTDDDVLQLLAPEGPVPPPTAEIHVRLVSRPHGAYTLVIGPHAAQDAGSAAARLSRLLPDLLPTSLPQDGGPVVAAEIVCRPLTARTAALTGECGTLPHRIPVGVPPREGDLLPADLAVASTRTGLVLWSRQLAAPVRPVLFSRVTRDLLPPTAQLLHLLGHAGERPWHPFTWTQAVPYAPFTPRVTFRDTVLAPRRWTLPDALTRAAARRETWTDRLEAWMAGARPDVPDTVLAEESDRHLLIDLTDPVHREILRRSVAAGTRTLAEAIGYTPAQAPVEGPDGRHLLELVVPLDRRSRYSAPVPLKPRTGARPRRSDHRTTRDGWLSTALAVPAIRQDAALAQLPPLPGTRLSYWLRYRTEALGPHLRVRARTTTASRFEVLDALTDWATQLAGQGLSDGLLHVEPYLRETQRYGGVDAIEHAERVFAVDSARALKALRLDEIGRLLLAARTIHTIALSLSPVHAHQAARGAALNASERRRRDEARALTGEPTGLDALAASEQAHRAAHDALAAALSPDVAAAVASDVIHMHCNRLLGLDAGAERIARSLATDLLHRR